MRLKSFIPSIAAAAMLLPIGANAVLIDTSVGKYEVTTVKGYSVSLLRSQVWWENTSLAEEFAELVGTEFGTPNLDGKHAPFFWVTDMDTGGPCFTYFGERYAGVVWDQGSGASVPVCVGTQPEGPFTFAVATPVTAVPEPSMAGLLCLGVAGLFLSSRRRSAVKAA